MSDSLEKADGSTMAEQQDTQQRPQAMVVNNRGLVVPTDHAQVWRVCEGWVTSGMVPKAFQPCAADGRRPALSARDAIGRVFYAHQSLVSVGVNPLTYLRFVAWVENQAMFFGDLPLTLVKLSRKLAVIPDEWWIDENGTRISLEAGNFRAKRFGAVCEMRARGQKETRRRWFTLDDAIAMDKYPNAKGTNVSQWWSKGVWAKHTNRMLQMRARAWLIKDMFPEVLNGIPQLEYDARQEVDAQVFEASPASLHEPVAQHSAEAAHDLNALYSNSHDAAEPDTEEPNTGQSDAAEPDSLES